MYKSNTNSESHYRIGVKLCATILLFLGMLAALPIPLGPSGTLSAKLWPETNLPDALVGVAAPGPHVAVRHDPPMVESTALPDVTPKATDTLQQLGATELDEAAVATLPRDNPLRDHLIAPSASPNPPKAARSRPIETSGGRRHVRGPNIFGSLALAASNAPLASIAQRAFEDPGNATDRGPCDPAAVQHCGGDAGDPWGRVLAQGRQLSVVDQIEWINQQVNRRLRYVTDFISHSVDDYWSPARETMVRQSGDCEDFAILKMWLLEELGHASDDMFVVVVQSPRLSTRHAVLAVRYGTTHHVLDNLSAKVRVDTEIDDYRPIFSVNPKGLWIHGFPATREVASVVGPRTQPR